VVGSAITGRRRWAIVNSTGVSKNCAVATPAAFDISPTEIESRAELAAHLATGTLAGLTVQGLDLASDPPDLSGVDVTDTLFIACAFTTSDTVADLVRRGAGVVPSISQTPFPTQPSRLYTALDLVDGFAERGFDGMYDTTVYRHFLDHGGALPPIREALAQRMHDHGIDNALGETIHEWAVGGGGPVVGIMGGHAELRGSAGYFAAAELGHRLTRANCLVVSGGGPGVMEAANLGAYLATRNPAELAAAIETLRAAPDFNDHAAYTQLALEVRGRYPAGADWARHGGLSVPTWLYGHEPANLFAARIAKYFSNAIREDTVLRLARGGIIFAAGRAGTVQEVFQAATKAFYATDGASGPFVFIDVAFWTDTLPVRGLLERLMAGSAHGDQSHLVRFTDDPAEAVDIILEYGTPPEAKEHQRATP
jgi:predicted Rossmann-fold nucleotide-binding protein